MPAGVKMTPSVAATADERRQPTRRATMDNLTLITGASRGMGCPPRCVSGWRQRCC
jgi:hypothetical protein